MPNGKNKSKPHLGTWLCHYLTSGTKPLPLLVNEQQDTLRADNSSNEQWKTEEKEIIFSKWWKK